MKKRLVSIAVCSVLLVSLLAVGCSSSSPQGPESKVPSQYAQIRIVGSSLGGKTTTYATVFATMFNKYYPEIEWSSSSGDTGTNAIYLTNGTLALAGVTPANYVDAYKYETVPQSRLRAINLPTALSQYLFVIPADKPWKDLQEVPKGSYLPIGGTGSTPLAAEAMLAMAGRDMKKDFNVSVVSKDALAEAWRAGNTDIAFITISGVAPFLLNMDTSPRKFKPLGLTPDQVQKAKSTKAFEKLGFSGVEQTTLKDPNIGGALFKEEVMAPQQPNFLATRDDFPEDMAYRLAKIIDEHRDEMVKMFPAMDYATPQNLIKWAQPPVAMHSGVAKYYKEKGYLK